MNKIKQKIAEDCAQKYLLENDLDDKVLNKSKYRENTPENAKHWKYTSDVMVEFINRLDTKVISKLKSRLGNTERALLKIDNLYDDSTEASKIVSNYFNSLSTEE